MPSLLFLEILNVAGRRWRWEPDAAVDLADALGDLCFEVGEPDLASVASWVSRGLTAYDATYVALAEGRDLVLVTDEDAILEVAPEVTRALVGGT